MTGRQAPGQAAPAPGAASAVPAWSLASPCRCWSCNGQCGGTNHPDSCGPAADVDGRPICQACRDKADVFDRERHGARTTIDQEAVRLNPDVFDPRAFSLWLDARSARHLAAVLVARAAELDQQTAAEDAGQDQAAEDARHAGEQWPPGNGWPRHAEAPVDFWPVPR